MTALQAGFIGPADLPKVRLRLLNTGRYSRPNILFINEKVRYAFGYMGFTHTQYRQIFSLMFLKKWLLASEARQAVGGIPVGN